MKTKRKYAFLFVLLCFCTVIILYPAISSIAQDLSGAEGEVLTEEMSYDINRGCLSTAQTGELSDMDSNPTANINYLGAGLVNAFTFSGVNQLSEVVIVAPPKLNTRTGSGCQIQIGFDIKPGVPDLDLGFINLSPIKVEKTPCLQAKELSKKLNEALANNDVKTMMDVLKAMVNSVNEHGFLITKDASGYHATPIVAGGPTNTSFTYPAGTNVIFVVHVHPPNSSIAPSSTDIYGLNNYGPFFEGNIILHGEEMYLLHIADRSVYANFIQKSNQKGYYDKDSYNGWRKKSDIYKDFKDFQDIYTDMYKDVDATYPTQLYLMDKFKMGTTLQKWDAANNKFRPQKLNQIYNTNTGASSSFNMNGSTNNSPYQSITVNATDCP